MAEIGSISAGDIHNVSPSGQIGPLGSEYILHWGVRADDRWHIARDEKAIRQGIAEDGVSIETRLRVSGGDIVHRASSTPYKGKSLVVIEIENETPIPVALALFTSGSATWKCEEKTLTRDLIPIISASKAVGHCLIATSEDELLERLRSEEGQEEIERLNSGKGSQVAVVFPLPHSATLRLVFSGDNDGDSLPSPDDLPNLEGIANGWGVHLEQGSTAVLEDERLERILFSARRHLLVGCEQDLNSPYWLQGSPSYTPALAVVSMSLWGHSEAASRLLKQLIDQYQVSSFQHHEREYLSYLLWACSEFTLLHGNHEVSVPSLQWASEQVGNFLSSIPRRGIRRRSDHSFLRLGVESSISILQRSAQDEEAHRLQDVLPKIYRSNSISEYSASLPNALLNLDQAAKPLSKCLLDYLGASDNSDLLNRIIAKATPSGAFSSGERFQDPFASALFLIFLRRFLLSQPQKNVSTVALFPSYNPRWFNVPVEVSNMPTSNGGIGYAVRWHGDRPALLWEGNFSSEVSFISPEFDPNWESRETQGEALFPQQKPQETAIPLISPSSQRPAAPPRGHEEGKNFS